MSTDTERKLRAREWFKSYQRKPVRVDGRHMLTMITLVEQELFTILADYADDHEFQAALGQLSLAMGNPCLEFEGGKIELGLIKHATEFIKRLQAGRAATEPKVEHCAGIGQALRRWYAAGFTTLPAIFEEIKRQRKSPTATPGQPAATEPDPEMFPIDKTDEWEERQDENRQPLGTCEHRDHKSWPPHRQYKECKQWATTPTPGQAGVFSTTEPPIGATPGQCPKEGK